MKKKLNTSMSYGGSSLRITISEESDKLVEDASTRYGGVIFWHKNTHGYISETDQRNIGVSPGAPPVYSIYVLIQDTNKWVASNFSAAGAGFVHGWLYEQVTGMSVDDEPHGATSCASGFSLQWDDAAAGGSGRWMIKFSSQWLNQSGGSWNSTKGCGSDLSKMTTKGEAYIIIGAIVLLLNTQANYPFTSPPTTRLFLPSGTISSDPEKITNWDIPDQWEDNNVLWDGGKNKSNDFVFRLDPNDTTIMNSAFKPDNWSWNIP